MFQLASAWETEFCKMSITIPLRIYLILSLHQTTDAAKQERVYAYSIEQRCLSSMAALISLTDLVALDASRADSLLCV